MTDELTKVIDRIALRRLEWGGALCLNADEIALLITVARQALSAMQHKQIATDETTISNRLSDTVVAPDTNNMVTRNPAPHAAPPLAPSPSKTFQVAPNASRHGGVKCKPSGLKMENGLKPQDGLVGRWKLTSNYQWASHTVQMMKAAGDALAAAIEAKDAEIEELDDGLLIAKVRIQELREALEEIADKDGYINSKAYARAALKDDTIA